MGTKKKITNPLLKSWNDYLDETYGGDDIPKRQHDECQLAFYGGYFKCLEHMKELFDYPPEKAREIAITRLDWFMNFYRNFKDKLQDDEDF